MTAVVGSRNLVHEADSFTVEGSLDGDNLRSVFTEIPAAIVIGPSSPVPGRSRINVTWPEIVNPTSFALHHHRNIPSAATWRITRYNSIVQDVENIIDQSEELPVYPEYTAPGRLSQDEAAQSIYTFMSPADGVLAVKSAAARSARVRIFHGGEEVVLTVGMLAIMETSALSSGAVDGRGVGSTTDQPARPVETFNKGVAPADEEPVKVSTFNLAQMSADDAATLENVTRAAGLADPMWFQPYPWRATHANRYMEGGLVRLQSPVRVSATRPQDGTAADLYEARGISVTPWR